MKHKWSDKTRAPNGDSRKVCTHEGCEIVCVSCHRIDDHGRKYHHKEWWRGSQKIQVGGSTPACEAAEVSPL
ncbi:cytochrome C [Bradyrhizobium sp. DASA03005]|uniref:cytochrome C n=1 Tax=Bradyrhizobium sp. SPXBL-02 TaxID=3395912 RepID=UPI003F6E7B62